ncbi:MAG: hypothetical protein QOK26_31 [Pseudonocardiales bacterium]|nr:hypothetical protein [Pseudonocardiales bacterium]
MQRSWVLLPVAAAALLITQLDTPTLPAGYIDPVALATATAAATWHCVLPHRAHRVALRSTGRPPLTVSDSQLTAAEDDAPGRSKEVPGLGTGPGENPRAQINGELTGADSTESYRIPMRAGEVLGVSVAGGARQLEIRDPKGTLVEGSSADRASSYPQTSPLPGGGNATVDHVAAVTGTHVLTVSKGTGAYQATVSILAPPTAGPQQIFLDFNGPPVDTRIFGQDTGAAQPRKLSPLSSFLAAWGLPATDEPALIQKITDRVAANLRGAGGGTPIEVTNSARSPNIWGRPDVSRVVIGGTAAEAGIDTVGISESVDPGNFDRNETALVLLDSLSRPASEAISLNHYLANGGDRLDFIAHAVGNIASHESGHFLGSWHTDPNSGRHDLMAPGDLVGAFGYGPDGTGGTTDDTRPKFGQDTFAPAEGFTGTEDTRNRTEVGLGGGNRPARG